MPRAKSDLKRRNVFIPDEHWERLEKIATLDRSSVSVIIRQLINKFLKEGK